MNVAHATIRALAVTAVSAGVLIGCATPQDAQGDDPLVVTTSAIVADVVGAVAGDAVEVVSVIPNGFDAHTYEPKPSEMELLTRADVIVLADANLNQGITQLAQLSGDRSRLVDLNEVGVAPADRIYRPGSSSWNPHTWTDPNLVAAWVEPVVAVLTALEPAAAATFAANAEAYVADLSALDASITEAFADVPASRRKLVVYHDAWEYFGRRYGLEVVGALQAVNFAEPAAAELAAMADQIRAAEVPAFFGSEVFPSDVLEALESSSGARYIPNLADDRLLGNPGDAVYGYIPLMQANLALLLDGLA